MNKHKQGQGRVGGGGAVDALRACFNMDRIKTGTAPGIFLILFALCTWNLLVSWNVKLRDLWDLRVLPECFLLTLFVAC